MSKTNTIAASNSTTADDIWEIKIANQVLSQQTPDETEPQCITNKNTWLKAKQM